MKKFTCRESTFSLALLLGLLTAGSLMAAPSPLLAQASPPQKPLAQDYMTQDHVTQDHVIAPSQIQSDLSSASAVRRQNEEQLKSFLSMQEIQRAMKSEGVDPQQVTNAVSQLSDADLARLAAQSQKAQQDFAAGTLGLGLFTLIGIVVVAVILIAIFA